MAHTKHFHARLPTAVNYTQTHSARSQIITCNGFFQHIPLRASHTTTAVVVRRRDVIERACERAQTLNSHIIITRAYVIYSVCGDNNRKLFLKSSVFFIWAARKRRFMAKPNNYQSTGNCDRQKNHSTSSCSVLSTCCHHHYSAITSKNTSMRPDKVAEKTHNWLCEGMKLLNGISIQGTFHSACGRATAAVPETPLATYPHYAQVRWKLYATSSIYSCLLKLKLLLLSKKKPGDGSNFIHYANNKRQHLHIAIKQNVKRIKKCWFCLVRWRKWLICTAPPARGYNADGASSVK